MPGLAEHGQALQHVLGDVSTLATRDLVALFNTHGDNEHFPSLLRKAFGEIVRPYAQAAATITARWYRELLPHSDFKPTPIVELPDARIDKSVDWAINAPTSKSGGGVAVPNDVILGRVSGSSQRMINDASRTTVTRNAEEEGSKWVRLAAEDACAFCKLLALRGAVYNSYGVIEDNIGVKRLVVVGRNGRARGKRQIGESYHDCCRCVAVPVRKGSTWNPPDYVKEWAEQYRDAKKAAGGASDLKAILAKMRAADRARQSEADNTADEHDHVLPPVELDYV